MSEIKSYILGLLNSKGIALATNKASLLEQFVIENDNTALVQGILKNQQLLMDKWRIKNRIADIINQQISIPNGTIGKLYKATIDFKQLQLTDLVFEQWQGLEEVGLSFDKEKDTIEGTPIQSGDLKIKLLFKIVGESEETTPNEKVITLIINPDPKSLWKDIPSDATDMYWKEDDVSVAGKLGEKNIVVSSKRGRSHKNVGSFRDDDFAFKFIEQTGWSVVAVSDGAGSYALSRKGSELACRSLIDYFEHHADLEKSNEFEAKIEEYISTKDETILKEIEVLSKQNLYKAIVHVHNAIKEHAAETFKSNPELFTNPKAKTFLDYYHATFIFSLFKKYEFGYIVLTFGVGDCPIAIMDSDQTETTLLNWLDVGEHGGGTRFITEPDIFVNKDRPIVSRFNFKIVEDFSCLFLMTDGIYDAKFVVEANLEKSENWKVFLEDLKGNNDENKAIDFSVENQEIATQLSSWMDFWSPGNHDDRTLAIVY